MQAVYNIMETILPYAWIKYDFMKNAFIAILFITPLFGILGTMIVHKKMAFFSDALGHSAITGVAIGVLCSFIPSDVGMIVFAVVFALLLNRIKKRQTYATDTVISVFSSCSIAIGLLILSRGGNFSNYANLMVGDILSISVREILYVIAVFAFILVFWGLCFNRIMEASINQTLARSRGIKVDFYENIFAVCIAVIVMISIKWVGILLINALLILPVAASKNISVNMREYHFFAILFSMFSGIVGLITSYYINVATGPMIVLIAGIIYFITFAYSKIIKI